MNRIEKKLQSLQEKKEKAFITYITAGLPDMDHCAKLIRAQEEAGLDILELGIPFSDPAADGPVIQDASYRSILKGTNLRKCFELVDGVRKDGCELPIVFMMYYNTVLHYGLEAFAEKCAKVGVDGLIIPDLPLEEQQLYMHGVDALVTNVPGVCIAVSTADCVPVLLYAPDVKTVAAIHAGWRGTVQRIVAKNRSLPY